MHFSKSLMIALMELIQNPVFWVGVLFFLCAVVYFFRNYVKAFFSGLFGDYVLDAGLSFGDELFTGLAGIDIGDWLGATLLYLKYRKQVGDVFAFLLLAEAANFFILSFIPGFGTGIEYFFNLFPLVTLTLFFKQWQANRVFTPIHEYNSYLKDNESTAAKKLAPAYDEFKKLYDSCMYQEIIRKGSWQKEVFFAEIKQLILTKITTIQNSLLKIMEEQPGISKQEIDAFAARLQNCMQLIDTDWRYAADEAALLQQQIASLGYSAQQTNATSFFSPERQQTAPPLDKSFFGTLVEHAQQQPFEPANNTDDYNSTEERKAV